MLFSWIKWTARVIRTHPLLTVSRAVRQYLNGTPSVWINFLSGTTVRRWADGYSAACLCWLRVIQRHWVVFECGDQVGADDNSTRCRGSCNEHFWVDGSREHCSMRYNSTQQPRLTLKDGENIKFPVLRVQFLKAAKMSSREGIGSSNPGEGRTEDGPRVKKN